MANEDVMEKTALEFGNKPIKLDFRTTPTSLDFGSKKTNLNFKDTPIYLDFNGTSYHITPDEMQNPAITLGEDLFNYNNRIKDYRNRLEKEIQKYEAVNREKLQKFGEKAIKSSSIKRLDEMKRNYNSINTFVAKLPKDLLEYFDKGFELPTDNQQRRELYEKWYDEINQIDMKSDDAKFAIRKIFPELKAAFVDSSKEQDKTKPVTYLKPDKDAEEEYFKKKREKLSEYIDTGVQQPIETGLPTPGYSNTLSKEEFMSALEGYFISKLHSKGKDSDIDTIIERGGIYNFDKDLSYLNRLLSRDVKEEYKRIYKTPIGTAVGSFVNSALSSLPFGPELGLNPKFKAYDYYLRAKGDIGADRGMAENIVSTSLGSLLGVILDFYLTAEVVGVVGKGLEAVATPSKVGRLINNIGKALTWIKEGATSNKIYGSTRSIGENLKAIFSDIRPAIQRVVGSGLTFGTSSVLRNATSDYHNGMKEIGEKFGEDFLNGLITEVPMLFKSYPTVLAGIILTSSLQNLNQIKDGEYGSTLSNIATWVLIDALFQGRFKKPSYKATVGETKTAIDQLRKYMMKQFPTDTLDQINQRIYFVISRFYGIRNFRDIENESILRFKTAGEFAEDYHKNLVINIRKDNPEMSMGEIENYINKQFGGIDGLKELWERTRVAKEHFFNEKDFQNDFVNNFDYTFLLDRMFKSSLGKTLRSNARMYMQKGMPVDEALNRARNDIFESLKKFNEIRKYAEKDFGLAIDTAMENAITGRIENWFSDRSSKHVSRQLVFDIRKFIKENKDAFKDSKKNGRIRSILRRKLYKIIDDSVKNKINAPLKTVAVEKIIDTYKAFLDEPFQLYKINILDERNAKDIIVDRDMIMLRPVFKERFGDVLKVIEKKLKDDKLRHLNASIMRTRTGEIAIVYEKQGNSGMRESNAKLIHDMIREIPNSVKEDGRTTYGPTYRTGWITKIDRPFEFLYYTMPRLKQLYELIYDVYSKGIEGLGGRDVIKRNKALTLIYNNIAHIKDALDTYMTNQDQISKIIVPFRYGNVKELSRAVDSSKMVLGLFPIISRGKQLDELATQTSVMRTELLPINDMFHRMFLKFASAKPEIEKGLKEVSKKVDDDITFDFDSMKYPLSHRTAEFIKTIMDEYPTMRDEIYKLANVTNVEYETFIDSAIQKFFKYIGNLTGSTSFKNLAKSIHDLFSKPFYRNSNEYFKHIFVAYQQGASRFEFLIDNILNDVLPELKKPQDPSVLEATHYEMPDDKFIERFKNNPNFPLMLKIKYVHRILNDALMHVSELMFPKDPNSPGYRPEHALLGIPQLKGFDYAGLAETFIKDFKTYAIDNPKLFDGRDSNPTISMLQNYALKLKQSIPIEIKDLTINDLIMTIPENVIGPNNRMIPNVVNERGVVIPLREAAKRDLILKDQVSQMMKKKKKTDFEINWLKEKTEYFERVVRPEWNDYLNFMIGIRNKLNELRRKGFEHIRHVIYSRDAFDMKNNSTLLNSPQDVNQSSAKAYELQAKRFFDSFDDILEEGMTFEADIRKVLRMQYAYFFRKAENFFLFRNFKNTRFIIDEDEFFKIRDDLRDARNKYNLLVESDKRLKAYKTLAMLLKLKARTIGQRNDILDDKIKLALITARNEILEEIPAFKETGEKVAEIEGALERRDIDKISEILDVLNKLYKEYEDDFNSGKINVAKRNMMALQERFDMYDQPIEKALSTNDIFAIDPGKRAYMHRDLFDALKEVRNMDTRNDNIAIRMWTKFAENIKRRKFYMPLRMFINDVWSLLMYDPTAMGEIPQAIKILKEGMSNETYFAAKFLNAFNERAGNRFIRDTDMASFMNKVYNKNLYKKNPEMYKYLTEVKNRYHNYFVKEKPMQMLDWLFDTVGLQKFYDLTNDWAWSIDRIIRLAMILKLRKAGMSMENAVDRMQLYMAEYDRIPEKTKRFLQNFLFVPSYKLATIRLWKEIAKGGADLDKDMIKSIFWLTMTRIGAELLLEQLGYSKDKKGLYGIAGYRFFKGEDDNVKFVSVSAPAYELDKIVANGWKYLANQLHPAIWAVVGTLTGKAPYGQYIENPEDDKSLVMIKRLMYLMSFLYPFTAELTDILPSFVGMGKADDVTALENIINVLGIVSIYKYDYQVEKLIERKMSVMEDPRFTPKQKRDIVSSINAKISYRRSSVKTINNIMKINDVQKKNRLMQMYINKKLKQRDFNDDKI